MLRRVGGDSDGSGLAVPDCAQPATGTGLSNYTISYHGGSLTVKPAVLDITANSSSKTYGQTVTLAGTAFTVGAGELLNGNTVTSVTLTSAGSAASAPVGSYPIVPSAAVGTGLGNYTINYHNGSLTVTAATLADLVVSTSGQKTAVSGRDVIYAINVTNYGPGTAQNVVVTDMLPAGTTFVSATSSNAAMLPVATTVNAGRDHHRHLHRGVDGRRPAASSESIVIDATVNSNVASGATLTNNVAVTTPTTQAQAKGATSPSAPPASRPRSTWMGPRWCPVCKPPE